MEIIYEEYAKMEKKQETIADGVLEAFKELRGLLHNPAPAEWEDGNPYEVRKSGEKSFIFRFYKTDGEWIYLEKDPKKIQLSRGKRDKLNKKIERLLGKIDPRTFGKSQEELEEAYDILWSVSIGLGHGSLKKAGADLIITYIYSVSTCPLHWADLWARACLFVEDYPSATNILESFYEKGIVPLRHATEFSHAKKLHATLYLGKAYISAIYQNDLQDALVWAKRAKLCCAGVPGAVNAAKKITTLARAAGKLISEGMDEEAAFKKTMLAEKEIKQIPILLLEGREFDHAKQDEPKD